MDAIPDFVSDEGIVWVDIEGIPLKFWSQATFAKIGKIWGEVMDIDETPVIFKGKVNFVRAKELFTWTPCFLEYKESGYVSDDESIRDTNNKPDESQLGGYALVNANRDEQQSEDSFGFYILLNKPNTNICDDTEPSLLHPLGFTPEVSQQETNKNDSTLRRENIKELPLEKESSPTVNSKPKSNLQDYHVDETSSGLPTRIHSRTTSNGGSILEISDGMIK
nr:hypothetical protein [Tanacetum cinerariifolium]